MGGDHRIKSDDDAKGATMTPKNTTPRSPLPSSYPVNEKNIGKIRLHYGLRALVFLGCAAICCTAVLPIGFIHNSTRAVWLGILLLFGFALAYKFSKPALAAALALPKRGRSITLWNALGITTAVSYAANGWGYLGDDSASLIICIAGTAFFGVVLFSSIRMFLSPAVGGLLIQMVDAHRSNSENGSK